jgi:hypothetical protein
LIGYSEFPPFTERACEGFQRTQQAKIKQEIM